MNTKNIKILLLISNAILPLIFGLGIYVFMKSGTYINSFLNLDFSYVPKTILGFFVVNWFCDFLWSYSLVFTLYLVLYPFKNRLVFSCLISAFSGFILEILQGISILSGTFDWWDIVIELVAVFLASLFLNKVKQKDGS